MQTLKTQFPGLAPKDLAKKAGEVWKEISDMDKQVFLDKYDAEKKAYKIALEECVAARPNMSCTPGIVTPSH